MKGDRKGKTQDRSQERRRKKTSDESRRDKQEYRYQITRPEDRSEEKTEARIKIGGGGAQNKRVQERETTKGRRIGRLARIEGETQTTTRPRKQGQEKQ